MARKRLTEEIYSKMYDDYKCGFSVTQLSEKYDFKPVTIRNQFNKRGLYFSSSKKFTEEELENIISDYQKGMKPYELEKKYNRRSGTIIEKLRSIGIYELSLHHFNEEEIELLKVYYPIGDWESIKQLMPDVSRSSIHTKMSKLGIKQNSFHWTQADIDILKENYEYMYGHVDDLVELFEGRYTYKAICSKAKKLGLRTRDYWNDEEIKIMKDNYSNSSVDEMLLLLPNRTRHSIIGKAISLNLKSCCKYQDWEVQFIIDNWKNMSDKEMSKSLSKSFRGLKNKRISLGLFRTKEKSCYMGIHDYLRANNMFWKQEAMKNSNYKCVISGTRFDDIHHIYSFNLIVSEVIELLDIDLQKSMDDFSKDELKEILLTFRNIQSSYPIGVCLSKEIHQLFHDLYGYGNTTEKEWNEFVTNYKNNKYNHLIGVA